MHDLQSSYEIDHTQEDCIENKIIVDVPSTALSNPPDYDVSISYWDAHDIREAAASLKNTIRRASDSVKPFLASEYYAEMFSKPISASGSAARIADSIQPLAASIALDGAAAVVENAGKAIPISSSLTNDICNNAAKSISSVIADVSAGVSLVNSVIKPASSLVESRAAVKEYPVVKAADMDVTAFDTITQNVGFAVSALPAAKKAEQVQTAVNTISEKLVYTFNISNILSSISAKMLEYSRRIIDDFYERIKAPITKVIESLRSFFNSAGHNLHRFARLLYRSLLLKHKKRFPRLELPYHDSVIRAAALVKVGLSPPEQPREFAVSLRKSYLRKRQRIGDDSDDMGNNSLQYAASL